MGKGASSPQAVWHSLLWDGAVSREKNNGKKICLSLLILCLVSESGCISFALSNHSQSKHGMKLFFDQTQYFYFNVLLFEVFLLNSYRFTQPQLTLLGGKGEESLIEITKNIYLVNSRKQKSHRKVPARGPKCVDGF